MPDSFDMTGPEWDCAFLALPAPTEEETKRSYEISAVGAVVAIVSAIGYHYISSNPKISLTIVSAIGGLLLGSSLYEYSLPKLEITKKREACHEEYLRTHGG